MPWKGVTASEQRLRFLEDYKLNCKTSRLPGKSPEKSAVSRILAPGPSSCRHETLICGTTTGMNGAPLLIGFGPPIRT